MSTAVVTPATRAPRTGPRQGLAQVVASEWTKLRSVRSTLWSLLALAVVMVGFGALASWGTATTFEDVPAQQREDFDAVGTSLAGLALGQLAIAVLGVLVISSEYSTGGIRTSLTAVPRRWRLVVAKALVFGTVALVVGTVTSVLAFFVGQPFLATAGLETSLSEPGVLRAVLGGGLYLLGSGMLGFALGTLLRRTPGAIVAAIALLLVVPPLTLLLPGSVGEAISRAFTSNAGQSISLVDPQGQDLLGPWTGYGVFTLWWVVLLVAGVLLMQRRDA